MKRFAGCLAVIVFFSFAAVSFSQVAPSAESADTGDLGLTAGDIERKINSLFARIDGGLSRAAGELSQKGIEDPETRTILGDLYKKVPYVINCAALDASGKISAVEPKDYASVEGSDVSEQEHVIKLHETKEPVFSDTFLTIEGFNAVNFGYPVFSTGKELAGSVSALIRSEAMLAGTIAPIANKNGVEVWVMQTDGLVLYDQDREEIGKNVFTDPLYKPFTDFLSIAERISKEKTGSGSYEGLAAGLERKTTKDASWVTVGLYDNEWRVVVVKEQS
ncbi:MAG: hypothetical protein PHE61_01940 [Candidatus Omnitrophica bacterium]|nr:hypothetical protein [Candidatus Omnitrophota bacterium]